MAQEEHDTIYDHVNFKLPPPSRGEEWRSMGELPTPAELNLSCGGQATEADVFQNVSLMRNDVSVPYNGTLRYLETHYRLNREHGITFLRYGVLQYKRNRLMMDNEHTCVYTKARSHCLHVFVRGYLMTRLGPVCRIQFSSQRAGKKIRWTTSPRLTHGSVVAISTAADNFQTICKVATIADRRFKDGLDQQPSLIDIFWANIQDAVIDPSQELVMIESRHGFFEAVRYTLVGLQHVAKSGSPILKYLVNGRNLDASPSFIMENPKIDLSPIIHYLPRDSLERARLLHPYRNYDILEGITDDIAPNTSLDNSQLQAVHRILTKELAIIQGPPGTGKTFTSVESLRCIVSTLTAGMTKEPDQVIIVAAETNHAVDQILTHLIKHDIKVLRLGGRTRDDEIKKYSLFNLRTRAMKRSWKDLKNIETTRKKQITEIENIINEFFPRELLDPSILLDDKLVTKEQYNSLIRETGNWQPPSRRPSGVLSEWLDESLQDISISRTHDPVFNNEEMSEDFENHSQNGRTHEPDADDPASDDGADDSHLRGTWIPIDRRWGGANPQNIPADNILMRRQMKKQDLWDVDKKWRGPIYEHWHKQALAKRYEAVTSLLSTYSQLCKSIKITGWKRDVQCIKMMNIHVVGCTTTGLSKYRGLLAALKPKTILIEEAAQSREAHIAAALLPSLQQLVLVGDHQQLPPHCDVPGLADGFHNLNVSMFERLVTHIHVPYIMLNQQRRMIPDIRALLNPFYPALGDHPSVWDKAHRPDVPGMLHNSYLFTHDWVEGTDVEMLSKYNEEEAKMVVGFAVYLIQNGVTAKQITILTFYRGQRKIIMHYARKSLVLLLGHANINVSTVDSYQGEENDIVLLSLVRSNVRNRPALAGFVGDMNRGVVAISRARRGFYVFGNIQNLEDATETSQFMWGNVRSIFERLGRYDPKDSRLPLRCQKHNTITYVYNAEGFNNTIGGCQAPCPEVFTTCNHPCGRKCHPISHDQLICQQPCERKLRCGHGCREKCGDRCRC
ncbi:P-loop containing nucleoside triphosphate hydrolase protein, partial [Truncatella angustata]